MDKHYETRSFIHTLTGALNFVGGDFTREKVAELSFEEVVDTCMRNGIQLSISISPDKVYKSRN